MAYRGEKICYLSTFNNKFTLAPTETDYNDIDVLNDIDLINNNEFSIFEFYTTQDLDILYTLAYYNNNQNSIYLNLYNSEEEQKYKIINVYEYSGNYSNITNISKNPMTYLDYCKICKNSNSIQDNFINQKMYEINKIADTLYLRLGDYKMTIEDEIDQQGIYFKISNLQVDEDTYLRNIPSQYYKESAMLRSKELFDIDINDKTTYLKMYIVTISISQQNYNVIVWKNSSNNSNNIIGRFEDKFDKPGTYKGLHNIVFDANDNKLDEFNNTSYILESYIQPPRGKYIK